ncbi:MAG: tRNA (guanosine(37)-N1)-methyltransferase TrmD [Desulfobacterales bacterium]
MRGSGKHAGLKHSDPVPMIRFVNLTIFPELFSSFLEHGIVRKAIDQKTIDVSTVNIRDFAKDRHRTTDDRPYGGGCGMVMKPEPLAAAIRHARNEVSDSKTILLTPQGQVLNQKMVRNFAYEKGLILVCGRSDGVDERICSDFIDHEISVGDYILTGGELGAMIIIEAITRLIPGSLGGTDSAEKDSFSDDLLEHAHYTRPRTFEGETVPEVLMSGNHKKIEKWRLETALIRTFLKRKDLLKNRAFTEQESNILKKWRFEIEEIIRTQSLCGPVALSGDQ